MTNIKKLPINENLPEGATELSPDELNGLIPNYISTRRYLNEFEKLNILHAMIWLSKTKHKYNDILTIDFCIKLHTKMFDKTWSWAGKFRNREINIGNIPPEQVGMRMKNALDDAKYWIENKIYPIDEICLRVHRVLVWIHPFPNGNGRHTRIICDELRRSFAQKAFTWGRSTDNLVNANEIRKNYIDALRQADKGDFGSLMNFALN